MRLTTKHEGTSPSSRYHSHWRGAALLIAAASLSGAVLTHYLELQQTSFAKTIRNIIEPRYYEGLDEAFTEVTEGSGAFEAVNVTHPVRAYLAVRSDVYCVLSRELQASPVPWPWCTSDYVVDEAKLLHVADWLLAIGQPRQFDGIEALMFPYNHDLPAYQVQAPWYSGLGQGQGGEVLLAAYLVSSNDKYLDGANRAANAFRIPIEAGGVAVDVGDGIWLEEIAARETADDPPRILNGHIYAMELLYFLNQVKPEDWGLLFQATYDAVDAHIMEYVSPFWSYYDMHGNYPSASYHHVHIRQLRQLLAWFPPSANIETAAAAMERSLVLPLGVFERLVLDPGRRLPFLWALNSAVVAGVLGLGWLIVVVGKRTVGRRHRAKAAEV